MTTVEIGCVVDPVEKWNPKREGDGTFIYVDISSIDRRTKAVSAPSLIDAVEAPSRARQLIAAGDVLVSTVRPNLNAVAYVKPELDGATASTGYCVLRPRPSELDGRYLFHWVRAVPFIAHLVQRVTGSSYPAVSDKIVKATPIPLPPIKEQERIAAVLDAAEALQEKRRQALVKLDILTQSVFVDMFGFDKICDVADRGWRVVQLHDVCKPKQWPTIKKTEMTQSGFPVYGANGVIGRYHSFNHAEPTILIGCRGTCGVINMCESRSWVTGNAMALNDLETSQVEPVYMVHALRADGLKAAITGTSQPQITQTSLRRIRIPLPPIEEQRRFGAIEIKIEQSRARQRNQLIQLDDLLASLQQRAFRGEL